MRTIWQELAEAGGLSQKILAPAASVCFADLVRGSALEGRAEELRDRSVLIATTDQLTAALAAIELDGMARRIILCPSDLTTEHLGLIIDQTTVDGVVSDQKERSSNLDIEHFTCTTNVVPAGYNRGATCETEWVLLTSGTTGPPKMAVHTLSSLTGAIKAGRSAKPIVWSTFYDIRRYGGLQIFLRAVLTGASLVLSSSQESTGDFLIRAGYNGVTHISGTPSHWRRALMSSSASRIAPEYVRLSGEIADQGILAHLQSAYPQAKVAHAFASTEAGVAFEVSDGFAGFPATLVGKCGDVEMKVEDGSLRIRSPRIADRYLASDTEPLADADGFVDTHDMVELRDARYYFVGRRDGVINVGGLKVHPEEVETVINCHPQVRMSLVRGRKNSITGALVVADVVLNTMPDSLDRDVHELQGDILKLCRRTLPSHKMPAAINFVSSLALAESGKLVRNRA